MDHSKSPDAVQPPVACAFLFDGYADDLPTLPARLFTQLVLNALAAADQEGRTHTQLRTGLPMLSTLAQRTTGVNAAERSRGRTVSHDMETYQFLVWDWLDSLSEGWSTIGMEPGTEIFRTGSAECVTLTAVDQTVASRIDASLQSAPGYVGAFAIDLHNPIHREAFVECLYYRAVVTNGGLVQELSLDDQEGDPLPGAEAFARPILWARYASLPEHGPRLPPVKPFSDRGARSASAFLRKHEGSVEHRALETIHEVFGWGKAAHPFELKAVGGPQDVLQALMPEGKFTHYLFNTAHKQGGSKAKFYIETLGIDPEDWRYLAAQFYEGLLTAEPENLEMQVWEGGGIGFRFNTYMRVRGRSGRSGVVRTGWMVRPGALPSLLSAPPSEKDQLAVEPPEPKILPPGERSAQQWETLWRWVQEAGQQAAGRVIPTPLFLEDHNPMPEGEIGYGMLVVARSDFAKWLVAQGLGYRGRQGAAIVRSLAPSMSLDRGVAWARAAARVIRLNGLVAEVQAQPD